MANEVATKNQFSISLQNELESVKSALPVDFNITRFVQNSVALLNGNESLIKYANVYGTAQIKAGLMRGAYLGLDALNQEMYLIPYKSTLQFMPSYKGMTKMAQKFSSRPIKSIFAHLVRENDEYEEIIINGEPTVNFKAVPFNDGPIIGAFAVCVFADGGQVVESMSRKEIEVCRSKSQAKNSPAWSSFWGEMAKKTVIRRLCKSITLDMDASTISAFEAGTEMETDIAELARRDIEENAGKQELVIDASDSEVFG
jgi:recombination protein RecT